MVSGQAGKGQTRRPCLTSRKEEDLRYRLATGKITFAEFERKMKKIKQVRNMR